MIIVYMSNSDASRKIDIAVGLYLMQFRQNTSNVGCQSSQYAYADKKKINKYYIMNFE